MRKAAFFVVIAALMLSLSAYSVAAGLNDDNVVAYYGGANLTDVAGNIDLTSSSPVYDTDGVIGNAYNLSTDGSHLVMNSTAEDIYSICYWAKHAKTIDHNSNYGTDRAFFAHNKTVGVLHNTVTWGGGWPSPAVSEVITYWVAYATVIYFSPDSHIAAMAGETYHHICFVCDGSDNMNLYINGSVVAAMTESGSPTCPNDIEWNIGRWVGEAAQYSWNGTADEIMLVNATMDAATVKQIYDNQSAGDTYPDWGGGGAPPAGSIDDQIKITVTDLYDSAAVSGANVTLSSGLSNLTDASGITTFDTNGTFTYNVTHVNYFDTDSTYNATNETDGAINITGAWVKINASNLLGNYLQNFSVCEGAVCNYTGASFTRFLLAPNRSFNITIIGYDGNHTPDINDTNQTYPNQTAVVNTTSKDLGFHTVADLYQSNLTINVSIGVTSTYISNFTANLTGPVNDTNTTTNYVSHFLLMNGDYEVEIDPVDYSLSFANITIGWRNYTPWVTIPAYALNSFYLTFRDEITRDVITENITIELISDATAGTYSTLNGTKALEILTPAAYTIRYRAFNSSSYVERDYYQNLVANNYYNLNLYDLLLADQKSLIVTVLDTSGDQVENATVKLLRYYTYCNCYEVVEMAVTAASGEAYFNVDEIDGHYKTSVDYDGVNRFLSTSPENFYSTESLITRTITINLGSDFYESLRASVGVGHSLSYNNATGALSFAWSDPSGLVDRGCLYAEYLDGVHYTQLTPSCQNASVGSVVLSLPEYGNVSYKYYAELEYNTQYSDDVVYTGIQGALLDYNFGPFGAFMGGLIVVSLALLVSFSAIAVVIMSALGVIALSALGFLPLGTAFIVGFATLALGLAAYFMRS